MATKTAYMKQVKGISFIGKSDSNNWVAMDGPENFGGSNAGTRPKELMLLSLAGCTGSDVVSILQKKRVGLKDFEINITAEETEDHPKVFTSMHVEYVFYGANLNEKDVERAIDLSLTRYCGVTTMYKKAFDVTHSYKIIRE